MIKMENFMLCTFYDKNIRAEIKRIILIFY